MRSIAIKNIGENLCKAIESNGCFANPWDTWREKTAGDLASWLCGRYERDSPKIKVDQNQIDALTVQKPTFCSNLEPDTLQMTWLGHASVLIEIDGFRVLCDPIFSNRCSPVGFAGPARLQSPPCSVEDLPLIDAVVISHTHYDHLDHQSVLDINRTQGLLRQDKHPPDLLWCVPQGTKSWMHSVLGKNCQVEECRWWDELTLPPSEHQQELKIVFVPAQHWSGRTPFDRNKCLWGGWVIMGPKHRAYFAGDTGYCDGFKEIGETLGPMNMSAIPIGAYEPRFFMSHQHVDPEGAVQMHIDVKSELTLAIHWGTFILTDEPILDPPKKLEEALKKNGVSENQFRTANHGGTLKYCDNQTKS
jgi:N-acyl-phosphatidylethanolamine-hydrolysing phospholipase D